MLTAIQIPNITKVAQADFIFVELINCEGGSSATSQDSGVSRQANIYPN